jgi:hypothetical protein
MPELVSVRRVSIGSITVHDLAAAEAGRIIHAWISTPAGQGGYVCTPNVDDVVRTMEAR